MRFDRVALTTGPRLHYAEQGDRGGESVVFLHGWPDSLPNAHLKIYDDTGHCANWERPERVAADIGAFLGVPVRGAPVRQ